MPMYLANNTAPIHFNYEPIIGRKVVLKGSTLLNAISDSYEFIIEEIKRELFIIRYSIFKFDNPTAVTSRSAIEGMHSRFMLKNAITHSIEKLGKLVIKEGQVAALWGEGSDCKVRYEASKEYITLDVFFSPGLTEQVAAFFPEVRKLVSNENLKLIGKQPCFITPSMKDVIRQIMECPFDEKTRDFYFDIKVRELLYVLLEQMYRDDKRSHRFTPYETSKLVEAREFLLKDFRKTPPTIRELSRIVALNEFKLKVGFKQLFGVGVFECFQEARMEKARELLLKTNKPIKDICSVTGYRSMTNFITAFRKKFGYTPGSLRRPH